MAQYNERLFSYGTLQYETVQLKTFGRKLHGKKASLPGYVMSSVEIQDPQVIAASGEKIHNIITHTGKVSHRIEGIVFDVSMQEIEHADAYEVSCYKRIQAELQSGELAWVYVSI